MLPWFNKYPTSDFHELNIDWLCTAYKNFYEQLKEFDTRLDGLETEVDQRLDAQDQRITDFEASVQAEFNQLRQDINDQFDSLETSFNERFTTLENNLTAEIEALEAQVNQEFEDLSSSFEARFESLESQVESALADFSTRLTDAEDDINILKDEDAALAGNLLSSGFYNYMNLPASETIFPDVESLTVNVGNGIIVASGTTDTDVSHTLGGGPNSFPAGMESMDADMHFYYTSNMIPGSGAPGQPLNFEVVFYQDGAEVDRKIFTWSGTPPMFDITSAYYDTLSGIELILKAVSGVTYNIRYAPMLAGALLSEDIITLKGLNNSVKNANKLISDRNYFDELVNSKNVADYPSVTPYVIEQDGITITVNARDIIVNGTASEPLDILIDAFSFSFEPNTEYKYYAYLISGSYTPTYQGDTLKQVIVFTDAQSINLFELNRFKMFNSTSIPYAVDYRIEVPVGSYDNVKFSLYVSKNMSNLQIEEDIVDLDLRVTDIENELMGESTYGPSNPVEFNDPVGDVPLKEVIIDIKPVQDLNGYEYPWPAGGNKNLVDITAGSYAAGASLWSGSLTLAAGTYTLSAVVQGSVPTIAILGIGSGPLPYTFVLDEATTITGIEAITAANISDVQLEAGSAPTAYVPYSNICPISGSEQVDLYHGENISSGDRLLINWQSEAGEIYWGYLNITTGEIVATHEAVTYDGDASENWYYRPASDSAAIVQSDMIAAYNRQNGACDTFDIVNNFSSHGVLLGASNNSIYVNKISNLGINTIVDFKTWLSTHPITVVYPLANPIISHVNPHSIRTIQGINKLFTWDATAADYDPYLTVQVTTQSFVESLIELYTERFVVSYNSSTQTMDKTFDEIVEAYIEGRRIVFSYQASGNTLLTELNQFDFTNAEFHFEYNDFTAAGIDFTEIVISSSGVSITTKSVSI